MSDYLLSNESVDGTEFSVDFDKREHTILVNSLFDIIYDPAQSYDVNNATGLGSKYFTVENYTDNVNGAGYTTSHPNQTDNYDSTSGLKVEDLFDKITPLPTDYYPYNGDKVGTSVSLLNLFTLTAYTRRILSPFLSYGRRQYDLDGYVKRTVRYCRKQVLH